MKHKSIGLMALALLTAFLLHPATLPAQGTAFSYEGQLNTPKGPATGSYDLAFTLYATNSGGTMVAGPVVNRATGVTNGLFATTIDFGPDVFTGTNYWLEIAVQTNGGDGFVTLAPRQALLPVPYAIFASSAATAGTLTGTLPASQISGTVPLAQIPAGVITNGETAVTITGNFYGNGAGLTNVPVNSLAAMTNFGIVAWGDNDYAEGTVPPGITNVAAVSSGYAHTLALLPNGTVAAWGADTAGDTAIPAGLNEVTQVAAGGYHSLALLNNGTVVAWGDNTNGQTKIPAGLDNVVAVAGGGYHSLALKSNGTVVAWGDNSNGQTNVPAGLTNVIAVAGGYLYSVALKSNGSVAAWGYNYFGQTSVPAGLSNVVAIAAGSSHVLALKNNGTVVAWGDNVDGQTTVPAGLSNVVAVAAGAYHSLALLSNGTVVVWGDNSYGERNLPAGLSNVVAVAAGCLAYDVVVIQKQLISPFEQLLTAGNNVFPGNLQIGGTMSAVFFAGGGGGLTELNASSLATGTVPLAQLPPQVLTNGESGVTLAGTLTGTLLGNATSATSAGVASNVVAGISITNAFLTNSVFAGNGSALTNLAYANITGTPVIPSTNGFVTAAVTNGLATTNFVIAQGYLTNGASGVTLSGTFSGNGAGLNNLAYASLTGTPVIPSTNGFVTAAVTNGLATTNFVITQGYLTNGASGVIVSGTFSGNGAGLNNLAYASLTGTPVIPSTNGFVTAAVTNGLATTNFVIAQGYLTNANGAYAALATNVVSGISITNAFITNSVFAGNGGGLTNLAYANLTGTPVIPATNGFVTAAVTNGLATITFVTSQGYLINANGANAALATNVVSGISITNAFITNSLFAGNGSGLSNVSVSAGNIVGSLSAAQLPGGLLTNGANGAFLNNVNLGGNVTYTGNAANNTAFGYSALQLLGNGQQNTAFGAYALEFTSGADNTGIGYNAAAFNTTGSNNLAVGYQALAFNTIGSQNAALGCDALISLTNGSGNIALGSGAGAGLNQGSSNIYIGSAGSSVESGVIRIGDGVSQTATYLSGTVTAAGFTGNGSGLTNLAYASLTGTPVIPSTNGLVTAAVTNGLATITFVTAQGYLTNASGANAALATNVVSGISITNAFITNSVFAGNGAGLANVSVNAGNILGTLSAAQLPSGVLISGTNGVTLQATLQNTAFGYAALTNSTGALGNSAFGYSALLNDSGGRNNSAFGDSALLNDSGGVDNSAFGYFALFQNISGSDNSAFGDDTLGNITNGVANTAVGAGALNNLIAGSGNIALGEGGAALLTNGSANIYIGNPGLGSESGTIRIGITGTQNFTYLAGVVTAASFVGNGSGLTNVTASQIAGGVLGGLGNTATGQFATAVGGFDNEAGGDYAFAAGLEAQATNTGSFVWADSLGVPFASTSSNTFSVRATGGVVLVTAGAGLTLDGLPVLTAATGASLGADQVFGGANTFANSDNFFNGVFSGDGSGLYNLSASSISGTLSTEQLPEGLVVNGQENVNLGGNFTGSLTGNADTATEALGLAGGLILTNEFITNSVIAGDGSGLTNVNAANITGSLSIAQLPSGLLLNGQEGANLEGTFTGEFFGNASSATVASGLVSGLALTNQFITNSVFAGDGRGLTNLNAAQLTGGTVPLALLPGNIVTNNASGVTLNNVSLGGTLTYTGTAAENTALGSGALIAITRGQQNSAFGTLALAANTSGGVNTALGDQALNLNQTGTGNTAAGYQALNNNVSGSFNTALGLDALAGVANGSGNVALGYATLTALTNGNNNIALGEGAGGSLTSGSADIYIGNPGTNSEGGVIRIGTAGVQFSTFLAGNVYANAFNMTSDRNAKENFTPVDAGEVLARVAALPVSEWNYKTDGKNVQHIGPMAQDFSAAFGLSGHDDKHISVVDEGGVALAAIQGLNQKVEAKDAEIQALKQQNDALAARLNELELAVQALTAQH